MRLRTGSIKGILLLLFLFGNLHLSFGQSGLCGGNLGDNIFTSGNFGSGVPNVLLNNPGYAPGFMYTTEVPPDDGEYTITNDIRDWSYVYPTWLQIGDNDVDPNGYMMVVNASFSPGIFYELIIDNLCENTLYEFSADVINLIKTGVNGHTLPNVSFLIDDIVSYSSGQIPQDEDWHTYGFTFTTDPGQFSIKLSLRNNAPGGTGNDLALDNISFNACGPNSSISIEPEGKICQNSLYPLLSANIDADTGVIQWQISFDTGVLWNDIAGAIDRTYQIQLLAAGNYYFRYLYSNTPSSLNNPKCRIVSDAILVEIVPVEFLIRDTICEGLSVVLGSTVYNETGIYQDSLIASNGCDSIVTLDLVVFPDPPIIADFNSQTPSCEGASDGSVFVTSISGVNPPYTFSIDGIVVPAPNTLVYLPAGTFRARIENEYGCFAEEEVIVQDGPAFEVIAMGDTTLILGHSTYLTAETSIVASSAFWTPSENVVCPICLATYVTPFENQYYIIEAMTAGGCVDTDSVLIRVDQTPVLYVPNIFSPNGDQINDNFSISVDPLNISSIDEFSIFDRWGGIIVHDKPSTTEQVLVLWDGSTSNGDALSGTYVFSIAYTMADGSKRTVHGDVTLIR